MARYSTKLKPKAKPKRSLMPIWLMLAGVGLVFAAIWGILGSAQPKANIEVAGAAKLKVDNDKINRGDIKLGTPVRDDIRVTNVGDKPLVFTEAPYVEVKEGC